MYHVEDDEQLMLDFLRAEKVLLVQGTGFNWPTPDHFRLVFLPAENELREAITRLGRFLATKR
jgi:alanine-synthesizing transaminase